MKKPSRWTPALKELLEIVGTNCKLKPKTVDKCLLACYVLMLQTLESNGEFRVPKFGTFRLRTKPEKIVKRKDSNGDMVFYHIPAENYVVFEPTKNFTRAINSDFKPKLINEKKQKNVPKNPRLKNPTVMCTAVDIMNRSIAQQNKQNNKKEKRTNGETRKESAD